MRAIDARRQVDELLFESAHDELVFEDQDARVFPQCTSVRYPLLNEGTFGKKQRAVSEIA